MEADDAPHTQRLVGCDPSKDRRDSEPAPGNLHRPGIAGQASPLERKGLNFIGLHELFDKITAIVCEFQDEIAERATALGGVAEGTIQAAAKRTRLPAYPVEIVSWRDHINRLADDLAAFGKDVRAAIDQTDKLGDKGTADLFTEISREIDKQLWFVEAHVQSDS